MRGDFLVEKEILKIILRARIKKIKTEKPNKKKLKANDLFSDLWNFMGTDTEKQSFGRMLYHTILNNRADFPDIVNVAKYKNNAAYYEIL